MTNTVLILGPTGKVGSHCAKAFRTAGWAVRLFDRKRDDMVEAARGCDVIVNGLNPPNYHNWRAIIPAITAKVVEAAKASGATVILPGNIYNYGNQAGELSERTPWIPCSRKGHIRVDMENAYRAAGVQTIVLRAGNFIDPDRDDDVLSAFHLREAKRKVILHGGRPEARQAYAFLPDLARAAVLLADQRDRLAQFEDVPFSGLCLSGLDLQQVVQDVTGGNYALKPFPWWLMTVASPFWELAREMAEMRYLFEMDHWISDEKLARLFPDFQITPVADVFAQALPRKINPDKPMRTSRKPVVAQ